MYVGFDVWVQEGGVEYIVDMPLVGELNLVYYVRNLFGDCEWPVSSWC